MASTYLGVTMANRYKNNAGPAGLGEHKKIVSQGDGLG